MIWDEPIHKPGPSYRNLNSRLLIPGGFPTSIQTHLPSAKRLAKADRNRNTLYEAADLSAQASCVKSWGPYIDTAFFISAYQLSSFSILDDYREFFERSLRKVIQFVDLLIVVDVERARSDDLIFLTNLLETRARKGRPTVVDDGKNDRWEDVYENLRNVVEAEV